MVGLPAQREAITFIKEEFKVSERKACKELSVERSSLRYKKRPDKNIDLKNRMTYWSEKRPRYGHPRIHEMVRRDGCPFTTNPGQQIPILTQPVMLLNQILI